MSMRALSSGSVFKLLTDLGATRASSTGKKLNGTEAKAALDTFGWNDGVVTKTEVIAARRGFEELQAAGQLTADGKQTFNDWFTAHGTGSPGGFDFMRTAEAFTNLQSFMQWSPESQKGATVTANEARSLLQVIGDQPAPARVAQVETLLGQLKGSGKSHSAQTVLKAWLTAHPVARPAEPLQSALKPLIKDVLWPSETDRPLQTVDLGPGPSTLSLSSARTLLNEPTHADLELRSFDDTFGQLSTNQDPNDPSGDARAARWASIRDALKANLTHLTIVRAGAIDIDVYALGRNPAGHWVGVGSSVVET